MRAWIGRSKGEKGVKDRRIGAVDLAPEGREEFFICQRVAAPSIVAPRAALESGGVAHCGRLR
jgi:hypothetical protein